MTENRVPPGVPTGGQFAASHRAEADLALAEPPRVGPQTPSSTDQIVTASIEWADDTQAARIVNDVVACLPAGDKHRPAYIALSPSDDYDEGLVTRVYDEEGNDLRVYTAVEPFLAGQVPEKFNGLDLSPGVQTAMLRESGDEADHRQVIDVRSVRNHDWAAAETRFRERAAFAAVLGAGFESYIVTPDVVRDQIDFEMTGPLSEVEREEIVTRVMDDRRLETAFDPVYDAVHNLVRRHAENVVEERA